MSVSTSGLTAFCFILFGSIAAVGCVNDTFEYKATAAWNMLETPNITVMTIEGHPYASGEVYTLDETFPSYDNAKASFVPKTVVFTTTTGTETFHIDLGACDDAIQTKVLSEPIVMESDRWLTTPSQQQPPQPSTAFYVDCGTCAGEKQMIGFCS